MRDIKFGGSDPSIELTVREKDNEAELIISDELEDDAAITLTPDQAAKLADWLKAWAKSQSGEAQLPDDANYTPRDRDVLELFWRLQTAIEGGKPNNHSEVDRIYAVTRTDVQKIQAYFAVYIAGERDMVGREGL